MPSSWMTHSALCLGLFLSYFHIAATPPKAEILADEQVDHLCRLLDLDDAAIEPITRAVNLLAQATENAVAQVIERTHGPSASKRYLDDVKSRRQFRHAAFVYAAASNVAQALGLSEEQSVSLRNILEREWDTRGETLTAAHLSAGISSLFPSRILERVLSEPQKQTFEQLAKDPSPQWLDLALPESPELSRVLDSIAEAHCQALLGQFQLNAAQAKKLRLVTRLAVKSAIKKRREAQAEFEEHSGLMPGPDVLEAVLCDEIGLFSGFSRWNRLVDAVLDREQAQIHQKVTRERARAAHEAQLHFLVACASDELMLTGKEEQRLLNLWRERLPFDPRGLGYSFRTVMAIGALTIPELSEVLDPEIATKVHALYQDARDMAKAHASSHGRRGD